MSISWLLWYAAWGGWGIIAQNLHLLIHRHHRSPLALRGPLNLCFYQREPSWIRGTDLNFLYRKVVIDASEDKEVDVLSDRVLDVLVEGEAVVSAVWPPEVSNGLLTAQQHGRITPAETTWFLSLNCVLPVKVEPCEPGSMALLVEVARAYNLLACNARYLLLAMLRRLLLATHDAALRKGATEAGVRLLPAYKFQSKSTHTALIYSPGQWV